jgi:hypothetical protein
MLCAVTFVELCQIELWSFEEPMQTSCERYIDYFIERRVQWQM